LKQPLQQPPTNPEAEKAGYGAGNQQPASNGTASNQPTNNEATNNDVSSPTPSTTTPTMASSTEQTCTPNWQCQEWQPVPETCGQAFTQNCAKWVDLNNCGINETPTATLSVVNGDAERLTTQQATGTKDCSASSTKSTSITSKR